MKINNLSPDIQKKYDEYLIYLVNFIKTVVQESNHTGVVLGLSGGVDSSLCAYLVQQAFPKNHLVVYLPCFDKQTDAKHAQLVARKYHLNFKSINLKPEYDLFAQQYKISNYQTHNNEVLKNIILGNLQARLRMTTLYLHAQSNNYLVIGTDNLTEFYLGYFTKYGDGGADLLPLICLNKSEVFVLASYVGVPDEIINKPPSAGFWYNQTDEQELGFSYQEIDKFLSKQFVEPDVLYKIKKWHVKSRHKRQLPIMPNVKLNEY